MSNIKSQLNFDFPSKNKWVNIAVGLGLLIGLYYVFKLVWWIIGILFPILFIATLILDYTVVWDFAKMLINLLKKNPTMGVIAILLVIIASPVVVLFLFGQVMLKRKVAQSKNTNASNESKDGEYVEFEDLTEPKLDLNRPRKEKEKRTNNFDDTNDYTNSDLW